MDLTTLLDPNNRNLTAFLLIVVFALTVYLMREIKYYREKLDDRDKKLDSRDEKYELLANQMIEAINLNT